MAHVVIEPELLSSDEHREAIEKFADGLAALKTTGFQFFIAIEPFVVLPDGRSGHSLVSHSSSAVFKRFQANEAAVMEVLGIIFNGRVNDSTRTRRFEVEADGQQREIKGH